MTLILLADVVLAFGVLELLALLLMQKRKLVLTLLAGLGLMLALRLVVGGADLHWVASALVASGGLHLVDLSRRWSSRHRLSAFNGLPIPQRERSP